MKLAFEKRIENVPMNTKGMLLYQEPTSIKTKSSLNLVITFQKLNMNALSHFSLNTEAVVK